MEKLELNKLRKDTIKQLEDVKNNLGYDMETNYCNMINTMIDYDNEAQDRVYLSDNARDSLNILDDELLEYYLKENNGMERLFYATRGLEFADSIYKIDAYGNLENVYEEDFESCIDDAIESLKEAIEEDKESENE